MTLAFWHCDRRVLWKGLGSTRWDIPSTNWIHSINTFETPLFDNLLSSFRDVFRTHTDLPPSEAYDLHIGHFEVLIMSFGLSKATTTFQNLINPVRHHLFCTTTRYNSLQNKDASLSATCMHPPERVLRSQLRRGVWRVLIKWFGLPAMDATLEPF
jgi:hypothetical protein